MILSTATEEIGHIELPATAVSMNLEGAKSEMVGRSDMDKSQLIRALRSLERH